MHPSDPRGRVLVLDDEVELLAALCEALRDEGFEAVGFADAEAALAALRADGFDVLLTDLMMPRTDGIRVLDQALEIDPSLAGIVMTGQGTVQTAVAAMKVGAHDYVLKPTRLEQLLPVLDRAVNRRRLRAERDRLRREAERAEAEKIRVLEEANSRLAALAGTDPLTGLANRRAFDEALARETALIDRLGRPLSLLVLDVDHFKRLNDTLGHPVGDTILQRIGDAVRACGRESDLPARIGGDEFAVLMPGADAVGALACAERIREAVAAGPWPAVPVTVSAGVATIGAGCPEAGSGQLAEAVDKALYQAKREGRNRVAAAPAHWTNGQKQPPDPEESPRRARGKHQTVPAGEPGDVVP